MAGGGYAIFFARSGAIRADREGSNQRFVGLVTPNGHPEPKQGEINFTPEFNGL
jgi:hypothetical protein